MTLEKPNDDFEYQNIDDLLENILMGEPSTLIEHIQHHPEDTLKKNAQFLVESSRKLPDYPPKLLISMETALKENDYKQVIELAIKQDANKRKIATRNKSPECTIEEFQENTSVSWEEVLETIVGQQLAKTIETLENTIVNLNTLKLYLRLM